jgi:hypothetical protein
MRAVAPKEKEKEITMGSLGEMEIANSVSRFVTKGPLTHS